MDWVGNGSGKWLWGRFITGMWISLFVVDAAWATRPECTWVSAVIAIVCGILAWLRVSGWVQALRAESPHA